MTEKRFTLKYIKEQHISANLYDNKTFIGSIGIGAELIVELLNTLSKENEQLQKEKMEYTKIFNCRNCEHLNYDWYVDSGEEFEVCDMGNTERMIYNRFCKDWKRS